MGKDSNVEIVEKKFRKKQRPLCTESQITTFNSLA